MNIYEFFFFLIWALALKTLCNQVTYGTTAASEMFGWAINNASSSAGATWNPLYLINSFNRSTMKSSSSSSTKPISPVCSHPSLSMVLFVASGSFRYPARQPQNHVWCQIFSIFHVMIIKFNSHHLFFFLYAKIIRLCVFFFHHQNSV